MAGDCLCVHAIRRDVTNRIRVRASASVFRDIASATSSNVSIESTANNHVFASVPFNSVCVVTAKLDLLRPMSVTMIAYVYVTPLPDKICGFDLTLTTISAVAPRAEKTNAVQFTFFSPPPNKPQKGVVRRACRLPLTITPGGDILPAFHYQAKIKEKPRAPLRKQSMSLLRGAKSDIKLVTEIAPNLTYFLDVEAKLKAETTLAQRADVGNMSALIKFAPLLGNAPTLPLLSNHPVLAQREGVGRLFPVSQKPFARWRQPKQKWRSPNELYMQQEHHPHSCYKENEKRPPCCDPRRFKFCCISTVFARPTSEAGELTRINKKKDNLRLVQVLHPDSKKQNEDGSFPPKKYVWRLTVHQKNEPPCACEFVHIGLYIFRDSVWKFNQSKPVLLLVNSAGYQSTSYNSCFDAFLPWVNFYPQFDERGEYRVVMVKNLMYDIYPPSTFVRTEYEGRPPAPVEREVILNELAHLVFVYEGCGNNFFLINAECD